MNDEQALAVIVYLASAVGVVFALSVAHHLHGIHGILQRWEQQREHERLDAQRRDRARDESIARDRMRLMFPQGSQGAFSNFGPQGYQAEERQ